MELAHQVVMADCIFCRIVAHKAPAKILYEDDTVLAFPTLKPAVHGHVMVVPKRHAINMLDIDPDQLRQVAASTQIVAKKVMAETKATGFNLLLANGKDARQSVFHFHWHIVPRRFWFEIRMGNSLRPLQLGLC